MVKLSIFLFAGVSAASSGALAQTTTGSQFNVQVQVTAGCKITTDIAGPVSFAATPGTSAAPTDVSSTASIVCTSTTPFDLNMSTVNGFKMINGAAQIPYVVLATPGGTQRTLGSTQITTGFTGTGSGVAQSIPFVFRIPSASWVSSLPLGTYSDTLTLNVNF